MCRVFFEVSARVAVFERACICRRCRCCCATGLLLTVLRGRSWLLSVCAAVCLPMCAAAAVVLQGRVAAGGGEAICCADRSAPQQQQQHARTAPPPRCHALPRAETRLAWRAAISCAFPNAAQCDCQPGRCCAAGWLAAGCCGLSVCCARPSCCSCCCCPRCCCHWSSAFEAVLKSLMVLTAWQLLCCSRLTQAGSRGATAALLHHLIVPIRLLHIPVSPKPAILKEGEYSCQLSART